jgi:hypothetical protein
MKNIHIIPTDKPSRLAKHSSGSFHIVSYIAHKKGLYKMTNQHIYITNDEEIKEGDWCYQVELNDGKVDKCYAVTLYHTWTNNGVDKKIKYKKIILTTDPDLIKDGVQSIDDEFLEWFVKNPSCESVDVNDWLDTNGNIAWGGDKRYQICNHLYDKIIIPQEEPKQIKCYCGHTITCDCEPLQETTGKEFYESADKVITVKKQETLEEAAKQSDKSKCKHFRREHTKEEVYDSFEEGFIKGAKWQQERMYSEEDMLRFAQKYSVNKLDKSHIQQYKKKFG